jgi:hypothetical protein
MPVEVTWDQCKQLISPGGAFSGTADAGGFIEGGEQARLMETCIGEGQVAADTDIDDKKSRRTKNNGTGKGDSLPKPNAAGGGNEVVEMKGTRTLAGQRWQQKTLRWRMVRLA